MNKKSKFVPAMSFGQWFSAKYVPVNANQNFILDSRDVKYVPSIGSAERHNKTHKEYDLFWWTEDSIFRYNALMVSAFYGMDYEGEENFREKYRIPRDNFLFIADSGGFQVLTKDVELDPKEVTKWQAQNCDVALMLDIPPSHPSSRQIKLNMSKFKKRAEISRSNYREMVKERDRLGSDLKLLKVLHGRTYKRMKTWYNKIKDIDADGYALAPRPLTEPIKFSMMVSLVKERADPDFVHILLGTGGKSLLPLTVYVSKYFDNVTFDSSSPLKSGAQFRDYHLPLIYRGIRFGERYTDEEKIKEEISKTKKMQEEAENELDKQLHKIAQRKQKEKLEEARNLDGLPCLCPVCRLSSVDTYTSEGSVPGALIGLHNLYTYLQRYKLLKSIRKDEELLRSYISKYCTSKTERAFRFLKVYEEDGLDRAIKKFGIGRGFKEVFR